MTKKIKLIHSYKTKHQHMLVLVDNLLVKWQQPARHYLKIQVMRLNSKIKSLIKSNIRLKNLTCLGSLVPRSLHNK